MDSLVEKLRSVVAGVLRLPVDKIAADARSTSYEEWDSLAHLQICLAVEETFEVRIPMERVAELDSLPALIAYLREQRGEGRSPSPIA